MAITAVIIMRLMLRRYDSIIAVKDDTLKCAIAMNVTYRTTTAQGYTDADEQSAGTTGACCAAGDDGDAHEIFDDWKCTMWQLATHNVQQMLFIILMMMVVIAVQKQDQDQRCHRVTYGSPWG